jgi:hypothetical protein
MAVDHLHKNSRRLCALAIPVVFCGYLLPSVHATALTPDLNALSRTQQAPSRAVTPERHYLAAFYAYAFSQTKAMLRLTEVEERADRGEIDRSRLLEAVRTTHAEIRQLWRTDYRDGSITVPEKYLRADLYLRQSYHLLMAGLIEYEKYFEDGDASHLRHGRTSLQHSENALAKATSIAVGKMRTAGI